VSWHPAIGDYRQQLLRIAVIAAMFAAAATLLGLHQQRTGLPSERWYQLARQQVMEADLAWRLADALEQFDQATRPGGTVADEMRDRAVAGWERRTLMRRPSHAAALRLGVTYGHRGYSEQAAEMLVLAASLDEAGSDYYTALAEVYSRSDVTDRSLREKALVIEAHKGWLSDLALTDLYRRIDAEDLLADVTARRHTTGARFAGGLAGLMAVTGVLFLIGVTKLAAIVFRWGLRRPKALAPTPFIVPWRLLDVVEAVAVLLFVMVAGGLITQLSLQKALAADRWPLGQPILMGIQYVLLSIVTVAVILYRVRAHAPRPFHALGLRLRNVCSLVGFGLSGYATFVALMLIVALIAGRVLGGAMPLGQTTEEIIGSAGSPAEIAIYFVLVCVLAPFFEELIFRGYVYAGLRRFLPARTAIILGAAAFAAVHLNAEAFLVLGLIGSMLCYLYERSRSLLPGMVAHSLHNGLVLAIMLLQAT